MTLSKKHTHSPVIGQAEAQATFQQLVQHQIRQPIRATFIDILEDEVAVFIGAQPYERIDERRDHRAGHRSRTLGTTAGVIDDLPVPRTRGGFRTQLFDRYQRRMHDVDTLMLDMFVGGVSQTAVGTVVEHLTVSLLLFMTPTFVAFANASPRIVMDSLPQMNQRSLQALYTGDAVSYAKDYNVSLDEALWRMNSAEKLGDLHDTLAAHEPDNFAGQWIDNGTEYRIVIQMLHGSENDVLKYTTDQKMADAVAVVHVPNSYTSLTTSQLELQVIAKEVSMPIGSGLNIKENHTEVCVEDQDAFETELRKKNIQFPSNVVIVEKPFPTPASTWYGGRTLSGCTTGFSVKHRTTTIRYVTTALCATMGETDLGL